MILRQQHGTAIFLFSVLMTLCACGSNSGSNDSQGAYQLTLVFPDDLPQRSAAQGGGIDCAAAGIELLRIRIYNNADALVKGIEFQCSRRRGTIADIPPGNGYRLVVTAEDADEESLLRGEAGGITIEAGRTTAGEPITMVYNDGGDRDGDGVAAPEDCDDADPRVYPGAVEIVGNQIDENCDGGDTAVWYLDADGDGFGDSEEIVSSPEQPVGYIAMGTDCDDTNPAIHPQAAEISGNGVDENCDGRDALVWYLDEDGDGFGAETQTAEGENQPTGYVGRGEDCNDRNPAINPDAEERPFNGTDENCDGEDRVSYTNDLGMTFTRIPAGTFMMGSPLGEPGRNEDETLHQVTLTRDFYMQTTEVTQGQWQALMGDNPAFFTHCGFDCPHDLGTSGEFAQSFITAINNRYQGEYICRLPTEAEWEYAARAGSSTAYANGDIINTATEEDPGTSSCKEEPFMNEMGWYCANSDADYSDCMESSEDDGTCRGVHPIAQKTPNAWGLYDMHGNVNELCQDFYGPYPLGPVTDPTGPSPETATETQVVRGGSWTDDPGKCRSAARSHEVNALTAFLPIFGFRLICNPVDM